VLADHGHAQVNEVVNADFVERVGALPHGRLALAPQALSETAFTDLTNDARVEDIWSRDELELLGAHGARWGENIIHLKEGLMFPHERELRGYHGAWSRVEQHIPMLLSGAGMRAGAELGACEIIDLAPTLALLLGGTTPEQSQGRILWEILDTDAAPDTRQYSDLMLKREELLSGFKTAKREFASGSIQHQEFATRRDEFKQRKIALLTEMERERTRLSEWMSR
jgi:arylsulfatase A-like enzyme